MLTIAITGGIGAGKSTLTEYLINKGFIVIDADKMAREMTAPGGKAIAYILEHFGTSYIAQDGSMDRGKMRDLVFNNPEYKKILEEGTTKVVIEDIEAIKSQAISEGHKVLFFDIPQLFENGIEDNYDQIWTIVADYDIKKQRVAKRDGISDEIIDLIVGTQAEDDYRISKSTEVIYNNGSKEELYTTINNLIRKYNL